MRISTSIFHLFLAAALATGHANAQADRWRLDPEGGITWRVQPGTVHRDHIEMSGQRVSVIVTYEVDERGMLRLSRNVIFPMLRFRPNETHDHLGLNFGDDAMPRILVDRRPLRHGAVTSVSHDGVMRVEVTAGRNRGLSLRRTLFPSVEKPLVVEMITVTNRSDKRVTVEMEDTAKTVRTSPSLGVDGGYIGSARVLNLGEKSLPPRSSATFTLVFSARRAVERPGRVDVEAELSARRERVDGIRGKLRLETPDPVLNALFGFAKIRVSESIYETKDGPMFGPGGGNFYAAIWANDQAEYANPFLPFLGDELATASAVNSFRQFARYMNPEYRPIPSSIISEGANTWQGAGDRGDAAMIAYGASRFALAYGVRGTAEQLWPLIEWCLEYCRRRINADGVVASDSDELEGRFPSGRANLNTSALYYDALNSAVMLGEELGKPSHLTADYAQRATAVRAAIEKYFGANVAGFDTYRYYDKKDLAGDPKFAGYANKPDALRAWIATPLTVDILDRRDATLRALFSPNLWTPDGLATEAGQATFWDRATLYGLRGAFAAGGTDAAVAHLSAYSRRRLLGDHVPYPVEAYPESNQSHLAAESALYGRVFTEGMFGIRPTGFRSFRISPRLPSGWDRMALRGVRAFGNVFDLVVRRSGAFLKIEVQKRNRPFTEHTVKDDGSDSVVITL